jgi:DNA-directed RNA polymerase specialized sigma subunit, sigma24 homolog
LNRGTESLQGPPRRRRDFFYGKLIFKEPNYNFHSLIDRGKRRFVKVDETPEYLAGQASLGDEESFTTLCDVLKTKLFRTAKGVLGNETLALDAVSEAVFRAFKGIKRLREPKYAETWFIRIVLNVAKDIKGRQKHEVSMETVPEGAHYDNHGDLEFFALIESLQKELREIISLKYYSDYTLSDSSIVNSRFFLAVPVIVNIIGL